MSEGLHLPHVLRVVADHVSLEAALKLAAEYGGQELSIPRKAAGSKLARLLGLPVARVLVELYGGKDAYIPSFSTRDAAHRRRLILTQPHRTDNDLAAALGISARWVRQVRANARPDPMQGDLFG